MVGNNDVNNNGNGSISYLYLGQDNILNVDHVLIGARKQQGNMSFQTGLTAPTLKMRGTDGTSRVMPFVLATNQTSRAVAIRPQAELI